jgi:hypothetical protein
MDGEAGAAEGFRAVIVIADACAAGDEEDFAGEVREFC